MNKLFYYLMTAPVLMAGDFNGSVIEEGVQPDSFLPSFRADSHAPIGVMGDHRHKKGEFMLSYRYMNMQMNENFIGTNAVTPQQVLDEGFAVTPISMDMEMHMVGLMYAPTDRITLMAMVNFVELSMDHVTRMGSTFTTESSGLGDSMIGALVGLYDDENSHLHLGLDLLLPTAEIEEEDFVPPAGQVQRLPYPMQLGAGSWGGKLSLTWYSLEEGWSYGAQASALTYFDENSQNYTLGDRYEATAWVAVPIGEKFSFSLRTRYSDWGNIDGVDSLIDGARNIVPTAREDLRGGSALDFSAGINFYHAKSGFRIAGEYSERVWQDLDGPQLGVDHSFTLGAQYAW